MSFQVHELTEASAGAIARIDDANVLPVELPMEFERTSVDNEVAAQPQGKQRRREAGDVVQSVSSTSEERVSGEGSIGMDFHLQSCEWDHVINNDGTIHVDKLPSTVNERIFKEYIPVNLASALLDQSDVSPIDKDRLRGFILPAIHAIVTQRQK
jgi:hypothetical protein